MPDGRFLLVLGRKPENIPRCARAAGMPARERHAEAAFRAARRPRRGRRAVDVAAAVVDAAAAPYPGAGINGDSFNRPSDVTWDRAGNIYVADGFGPQQPHRQVQQGRRLPQDLGQHRLGAGSVQRRSAASPATPPATFTSPTRATTAFRSSTAKARSRSQITGIGSPQAHLHLRRRERSSSTAPTRTIPRAWITARSTRSSLTGQVVGKFGKAGKMPKEFGMVNAIDCRTENNLWVGEVWNWRAQKVTLEVTGHCQGLGLRG